MAFQTIPSGFYLPDMLQQSTWSFSSLLIDAASEKVAAICQAPKTGTITKIGFVTRTVTTGDTVDVRLETVSLTTGDPSGTLFDTNTNASQVIDATDDNTWFLTTLTAGAAVIKGDLIAPVIVNGAGSGNMNIGVWRSTFIAIPYADHFTAAWAKQARSPVFAFEYSDGSYDISPGVYPMSASSGRSFSSSSTPDERGLKFKLPFPVRITGAWVAIDTDENADIVLYNSSDSVLETVSLDKDVRQTNNLTPHRILFSGTQELAIDTVYRLVVKPTTTTNVEIRDFDVDTAAIMDSVDGGQDFHYTERTDAGAWTDTTTRRPFMGIVCDAFDDGVSAGGAAGHAGMQGGMQ